MKKYILIFIICIIPIEANTHSKHYEGIIKIENIVTPSKSTLNLV